MRASSVAVLFVLASGCGGETGERAPQRVAAPMEPPAAEATPAEPTATVATPSPNRAHIRPLSTAERSRLKMIARRVDSAIDLFDSTARACPLASWEACVDRAWAVIVSDLDWPPYYLRRLDARTRGCEPLAFAVRGVNGFNLAARQLDYGDPAEYATPTRRRDSLALVDGLRPVPADLRAAASGCR